MERRLPVRTKLVKLEGDYEGWELTMVTSLPLGVIEDLQSGTLEGLHKGLAKTIRAPWNFVDEEGNPMPDPSQETIGLLPLDLIDAVVSAYMKQLGTLPQ